MKTLVFALLLTACDTFEAHPRGAAKDAGKDDASNPVLSRYERDAKCREMIATWVHTANAHDIEGVASLYVAGAPGLDARKSLLAAQPELVQSNRTVKCAESNAASFDERRRLPSHVETVHTTWTLDDKLRITKEETTAPLPDLDDAAAPISDATDLGSPITLTLAWKNNALVVTASDAKGKHSELFLHRGSHPDESLPALKSPSRAAYFETRISGPATTTDFYRVRQDGDFIVAARGVQAADIVQLDVGSIQLSPGAKVVPR